MKNLPDGKEIDERVEAYRRALTVHIYQEKLVEQELGSKVADSEIETYYNTHSEQFVATEPYLKGVFMKVPLHAASLKNVRAWMKNPEGNGNLDRLEKYSISHAVSYECFPDRWKPFSEISLQMPLVKKILTTCVGIGALRFLILLSAICCMSVKYCRWESVCRWNTLPEK